MHEKQVDILLAEDNPNDEMLALHVFKKLGTMESTSSTTRGSTTRAPAKNALAPRSRVSGIRQS